MPREHVREVVLDTACFTPDQLHTRFLLAHAMGGWAGWAREHLVAFNRLIADHGFGLVVTGVHAEWLAPFGFFDAASIEVATAMHIRRDGKLMRGDVSFRTGRRDVASCRVFVRPIRVTDASLAAQPADAGGEILRRFEADETFEGPVAQQVDDLVARLRADGEPVASGRHPFRVARADIEVADQWSFVEIPGFGAAAREALILAGGAPALSGALARPLVALDVRILRPLYVFDEAAVETEAVLHEGALRFVHAIRSDAGGGQEHAVLVESLAGAP